MSILRVEKLNVSEFKGISLSKEYKEYSKKVKERYERKNKEFMEKLPEGAENHIPQEEDITPPDIEFLINMYSQEYQNVEKSVEIYVDTDKIIAITDLIKEDNICKNFDVDSYFIVYAEAISFYVNGKDFEKVINTWAKYSL